MKTLLGTLVLALWSIGCGHEGIDTTDVNVTEVPAEDDFGVQQQGLVWSGCYIYPNKKTISLPNKSDLNVTAWPCVQWDADRVRAIIDVEWHNTGVAGIGSGHKFDSFSTHVRLERASNDADLRTNSCAQTSVINDKWDGSMRCATSWRSRGDGPYTSDGYIAYDKDDDGQGGFTWSLTGSPSFP
jgi:hypothetical protein